MPCPFTRGKTIWKYLDQYSDKDDFKPNNEIHILFSIKIFWKTLGHVQIVLDPSIMLWTRLKAIFPSYRMSAFPTRKKNHKLP
jgi:hypothetical protein